jgi:hypothetical protein
VVVSHSELRAHRYAAQRVFDDGAPAAAQLRVCPNGVRVRAVVGERSQGHAAGGMPAGRGDV